MVCDAHLPSGPLSGRPVQAKERDYELEQAKAEVARLSEAVKEMAVKLTLLEGNGGWD
jgi:transposase